MVGGAFGGVAAAWPQLLQNLDPKLRALPHAVQFMSCLLLVREVEYADDRGLVPYGPPPPPVFGGLLA